MVNRSGPVRRIAGADEAAWKEVAEWMKAIRDDGADIDEAIERLENADKAFFDRDMESGDPVDGGELDAE